MIIINYKISEMSYILKFAFIMKESPYNQIIDIELTEMIQNEFCNLPSKQIIKSPLTGEPMSVIIHWSDPPISDIMGENRAIYDDCLYSLPNVYSDSVVLLDTMARVKTIEETFPDRKFKELNSVYTFKDIKLVFHLSKTLDIHTLEQYKSQTQMASGIKSSQV